MQHWWLPKVFLCAWLFLLSPTPTAYSTFWIFQTCHVQYWNLDIFLPTYSSPSFLSSYWHCIFLVAKYKNTWSHLWLFFLFPTSNLSIILAALSSGSDHLLSSSQLLLLFNWRYFFPWYCNHLLTVLLASAVTTIIVLT